MTWTMTQEAWDAWEKERVERARADLDATAWQGKRTAASTDDLIDRIIDLEGRLYLSSLMVESAVELLERRTREHARTLELVDVIVRCDEILTDPRQLKAAA